MRTTLVFPDTNTFLHYPSVDHIDWCTHLNSQEAIIVVAPIVVRELNKRKDTPGPIKLRERASSVLKTLWRFSKLPEPIHIRKSVQIRFLTDDPPPEVFEKHDLAREVLDDYLVATILSFTEGTAEGDIILVTHDLGLELKASAKKIPTAQLPGDLKLPPELDAEQKHIRELEMEVFRLQRRLPDLALIFPPRGNLLRVRMKPPVELSDAALKWRMKRIHRRHPKIDRVPSTAELGVFGLMAGKSAIDEYNGQLDNFYATYEEYYARLQEYLNYKRRIVRLAITLVNSGSTPAEDVDILLVFPAGFELRGEGELDGPPAAPEPPTSPYELPELIRQSLEQFRTGVDLSRFVTGTHLSSPEIPNVSHPTIRKTNSYDVEVHVNSLKHRYEETLDPLYVIFPTYESAGSFSVSYGIYAANAPDKQEGKLSVILEK